MPVERLRDQVVGAFLERPADLLLEHRAHGGMGRRIVGLVDVGVADVAGHQAAVPVGDRARDPERLPVQVLEHVLAADQPQLLAVGVVGEGLDHVAAGVDEILVQALDRLGMVEHDLGHEGAGLEIAAPLQLEQVAFGADHRSGREPREQAAGGVARRSDGRHGSLLLARVGHMAAAARRSCRNAR